MIRSKLSALALASILTLPLATAGCSKGQSPTEPALFDEETSSVSSSSATSVASVTDESKGRGRGGKGGGKDDGTADDNNRRRGRGRGGNGGRNDDRGNDRGNDDRNNRPRNGQEFEGSVTSVGNSSVTIAGGTRIEVNGSTQWIGRGDLFSLSEIQGSLSAGRNPRVEGRGARQSDGSILAQTIKAEDND